MTTAPDTNPLARFVTAHPTAAQTLLRAALLAASVLTGLNQNPWTALIPIAALLGVTALLGALLWKQEPTSLPAFRRTSAVNLLIILAGLAAGWAL